MPSLRLWWALCARGHVVRVCDTGRWARSAWSDVGFRGSRLLDIVVGGMPEVLVHTAAAVLRAVREQVLQVQTTEALAALLSEVRPGSDAHEAATRVAA